MNLRRTVLPLAFTCNLQEFRSFQFKRIREVPTEVPWPNISSLPRMLS